MSAKRSELMDIAKGIAILAVVLAHCDIGLLGTFFFIFHLPIFFIISGYFFKPYDAKTFFRKKLKGYVIPLISCGTVLAAVNGVKDCITNDSRSPRFFLEEFLAIVVVQRRYTTLWFLAALFCGIVIFYALVRISPNDVTLAVSAVTLGIAFILYDTFIAIPPALEP